LAVTARAWRRWRAPRRYLGSVRSGGRFRRTESLWRSSKGATSPPDSPAGQRPRPI